MFYDVLRCSTTFYPDSIPIVSTLAWWWRRQKWLKRRWVQHPTTMYDVNLYDILRSFLIMGANLWGRMANLLIVIEYHQNREYICKLSLSTYTLDDLVSKFKVTEWPWLLHQGHIQIQIHYKTQILYILWGDPTNKVSLCYLRYCGAPTGIQDSHI